MFGRTAALSFVRLIFTLLSTQSSSSCPSQELLQTACSILEEELTLRPQVFSAGVRSMSHLVQMPKNSFSIVDKAAMDYDDKRVCHVCKCVCVFSAVVCECSYTRVACIRHESLMCKCSKYGLPVIFIKTMLSVFLLEPASRCWSGFPWTNLLTR